MSPSGTTTNPSITDRIVKTTVLRAPRSRVWRALTDPSSSAAGSGAT